EQEAFHSKPYDFSIPNNIDYFNKTSSQNYANTSKESSILKDDGEKLSNALNELQINSDKEEIYDDKNFHAEEQDELEIPDGKY
ncbi:hypothetical protein C1645_827989, partial [Glomus cerebriforme]